jgi:hypothetical protein
MLCKNGFEELDLINGVIEEKEMKEMGIEKEKDSEEIME